MALIISAVPEESLATKLLPQLE